MDEFVLFNFSLMVNEKQFRIVVPPQATWDECNEALNAFSVKFLEKKEESDKKIAEKKAAESLEANS